MLLFGGSVSTRLIKEAKRGQLARVDELLAELRAQNGHPNACDANGWTALHWATWKGHYAVVQSLVNAPRIDLEIRTVDKSRTALYLAAYKGLDRILFLLLGAGACVDTTDYGGYTVLHAAAEAGHGTVVRLLLEHLMRTSPGAVIPLLERVDKEYGWTAVHWAAYQGHIAVVRRLIGYGADASTPDPRARTAADIACTGERADMRNRKIIVEELNTPVTVGTERHDDRDRASGPATRPPRRGRREELLAAAAKPQLERQVFISHTGRDEAAKNFAASVLKPALEAAGLTVFMDYEGLGPGCEWPHELVAAAANSQVFVAVLSEQYPTRYWCMLELDLAQNAHEAAATTAGLPGSQLVGKSPVVIPVFYDDPTVVCGPRVGDWWSNWLSRPVVKYQQMPVQRAEWVDAAAWEGNIDSTQERYQHVQRGKYTSKDQDWLLACEVVAAAVQAMPKVLDVPSNLLRRRGTVVVQLARRLQELAELDPTAGLELQTNSELAEMELELPLQALLEGRPMLGLWLFGIGGLGKSTIAKELFNELSPNFCCSAIIELQKGDGPERLAAHLVAALQQLGSSAEAGASLSALTAKMKAWVGTRKVLYVLDNVWKASQLEVLLPVICGAGSVVIVTSRSGHYLDSSAYCAVKQDFLHMQLPLLTQEEARELFRNAASLWEPPGEGLQELEDDILKACGGLPLALCLAGGALNGQDAEEAWQGVLAALARGEGMGDSDNRLLGIVTHSLENLRAPCTSMFLDVATLLRGRPLNHAMAVWRAWWGATADGCFEDLKHGSLVGVDERGLLSMHEMLVAVGRGIVLQETPGFEKHFGSRIWVEDSINIGVGAAQMAQGGACAAPSTLLAAQLHLSGACDYGELAELALSAMRILWLKGAAEPASTKLLWLELDSTNDLNSWVQHQRNLVLLVAPHQSTICLPEGVTQLQQLHGIDFSWNQGLTILPPSFGQLSALQWLDLSGCKRLKTLPASLGEMSSLQSLDLSHCPKLTHLPDSIGKLMALEILDLSHCTRLRRLPDSLDLLKALRRLDVAGCVKLLGQVPNLLRDKDNVRKQKLEVGYIAPSVPTYSPDWGAGPGPSPKPQCHSVMSSNTGFVAATCPVDPTYTDRVPSSTRGVHPGLL